MYLPGICWAIIIFILSSISIGKSVLPDFWDLLSFDKAAHAFFYFLLYYLWARGLIKDGKKKRYFFFLLLILCVVYGAMLELYQGYFLSFRNGDWVDELANTLGAFSSYLYYLFKIKRA